MKGLSKQANYDEAVKNFKKDDVFYYWYRIKKEAQIISASFFDEFSPSWQPKSLRFCC